MKNELKIMFPLYRIIYPLLFMIFLSVFRGIADTREIGVTLDPMLAALSAVFMVDTYLIEHKEQRWEIFALYALDKKKAMVYKRIFVQFAYLFLLAAIGYFLFFIQNPSKEGWGTEAKLYFEYLSAVSVSLLFWGSMAITGANLFQNIWCGIGISLTIWLVLNSAFGADMFGKYNVFSYVFRSYGRGTGADWIPGKIIGFVLAVLMMSLLIPQTIKRRRI